MESNIPGRCLMENGYYILEYVFNNYELKPYESMEWQAKALSGEVLMPDEATKRLSVVEIIKKCKPKQIGIYKDNYLVTTIDFPDKHKNYFHANDWGIVGYDDKGAMSARIGERKTLTDHEKKLLSDLMKEYNGGM